MCGVDHFDGVVAECRDEEALADRVESKVVDPAADLRQLNRSCRPEPRLRLAVRCRLCDTESGGSDRNFKVSRTALPSYYRVATPLADVEVAKKVDLVKRANAAAYAHDKRIKQVTATYADNSKAIWIANTDNKLVADNHPDKLMGRGVPPEFVEIATRKLAAINAAYDSIAKERGL